MGLTPRVLVLFLLVARVATAEMAIDSALESSHVKVQAREALSVGTTTRLQLAAQTLAQNFQAIAGNGRDVITQTDLQRAIVVGGEDVREAARYFLVSPVSRLLAGDSAEHRGFTREGFAAAARLDAGSGLERVLLKLAQSDRTYAVLLRDPGVPAEVRAHIVARLSDERLTGICGRPNTKGDSRDVADERTAFTSLIRMSWLGAAEAEALAHYRIQFVMDRGSQDHDVSYWNGQNIHLSEKMITGGKPGYVAELLAHEGGHAIFDASGLKKRAFQQFDAAHVTAGAGDIVNEGFAGVFGNRGHVALFGLGDRGIDDHLVMINDVTGSLINDKTFYASRYHVNTAVARTQIDTIMQIMSRDLVPYLQEKFDLLGDPQLTLGLPAVR